MAKLLVIFLSKFIRERWPSPACRQAGAEGYNNMYYVYFLKSNKDGGIYIGKTNDLKRRISEHNGGYVSSTKSRRPFILLEYIQCPTEEKALEVEKEWKKGFKREEIKRKYNLI